MCYQCNKKHSTWILHFQGKKIKDDYIRKCKQRPCNAKKTWMTFFIQGFFNFFYKVNKKWHFSIQLLFTNPRWTWIITCYSKKNKKCTPNWIRYDNLAFTYFQVTTNCIIFQYAFHPLLSGNIEIHSSGLGLFPNRHC